MSRTWTNFAAEMDNKENDKKKKEMQDMERDERYVRRRQLKEAEEEDAPASKKTRLDLLDKLNPKASIFDILAASGSEPLPTLPEDQEVCSLFLEVVQTIASKVAMEDLPTFSEEQIINKETDTGIKAAGVLDIFEPLPMEVPDAEDKEAAEVGFNLYLFSLAVCLGLVDI